MGRRGTDRLEHGNPLLPRMLRGLLMNKGYEPRPFSTSTRAMADRRGARGGPFRTPATTPASCPPYLGVSVLEGGASTAPVFSVASGSCVIFCWLGGRRTAGRLQIGPDLPNMENLLAHARTNASIIIHNAEWAQHSWCAVRNKFGNISKRKTSFPFPCRVGSTPAGWDGVQWAGQETDRGRWESGRRPGRRSTSRGSRSFWGSWRRPCRRCLRRRSPRARPRR